MLFELSHLKRLSSITHSFPWLSSTRGYVTYPLLPRLPLSPLRVLARLACLIHAANVHSEPGSNPSICMNFAPRRGHLDAGRNPHPACIQQHEEITRKSLSLIIVLQISENQKLRFKSATHTVPPTFSGLSNQIAKEQTDE